jgi:hypothetical protein
MIPEADNKIAIKRADILPDITRLPGVSLSIGAQTVKGKRNTTRKKVVSNFIEQQMGRISFLNPRRHC